MAGLCKGSRCAVRWQGSDADGDVLSYDIEYSTDSGAQWQMLGVQLTKTEADLTLAWLPGSQHALFSHLGHGRR